MPTVPQLPDIILLTSGYAPGLITVEGGHTYHVATDAADLPSTIEPGTRIHVSDRWPRNDAVIDRLRLHHARLIKQFGPDRGLIDPTGLLGVETSTTQTGDIRAMRQITDSPPIGKNLEGNRRTAEPRKQQPTRRPGLR